MKTLAEIKDNPDFKPEENMGLREASRAVLIDENGLVPLLFVSRLNYHKLPGGGVDKGETKEQALEREILEEVGSRIKIVEEIGKVIEIRSKFNVKQVSYCYLGKILSKGEPNFTEEELRDGFRLVWVNLEKAISMLENESPGNYQGSLIKQRDLVVLKEARKMLSRKPLV